MQDENPGLPPSPVTSPPTPGELAGISALPPVLADGQPALDAPAVTTTPLPMAVTEPKAEDKQPQAPSRDGFREVVETIVFVTILWLLWKAFAFEPFVIPTGSMAETLLGYHKEVTCPQCGHTFPVNCSDEVEKKPPIPTLSCTCPNCLYAINFHKEGINPQPRSGDRVIVAKFFYDLPLGLLGRPEPYDVVVFRYPDGPVEHYAPKNYIKRLIGLPGQTIVIYQGDLYVAEGLEHPPEAFEFDSTLRKTYKLRDSQPFKEAILRGEKGFKILRKRPSPLLSLSRLVYDNDHQARDLIAAGFPPRWAAEADDPGLNVDDPLCSAEPYTDKRRRGQAAGTWQADDLRQPRRFTGIGPASGDFAWLRYRHLLRDQNNPLLITDFLGYNSLDSQLHQNWVGDLILECEVTVEQATGELVLELSRGADRFRAGWDLSSGVCTLSRLTGVTEQKLESKPTTLRQGTFRLRFANVDQRLVVWVNDGLVFGEGVTYEPPAQRGPTAHDLQPASIGVRGGRVSVRQLKLWRDTYYTVNHHGADVQVGLEALGDPLQWGDFDKLPASAFYIHPQHYLCLGDNSLRSSDGRNWGLVPEQLLLGRAVAVFYPFSRVGLIR